MKRPERAGSLLQGLLSAWGLEGKLREYRALVVWDETVGPQIAARARPARLRDGILEVKVDHPVWMQQLQLLKPKLLVCLNQRLGGEVVRDLFLRRGRIENSPLASAPEGPTIQKRPLTPEERQRIETALESVDDPELQRHLRNIFTRQALLSVRKPSGS